jgi:hypothetical protein
MPADTAVLTYFKLIREDERSWGMPTEGRCLVEFIEYSHANVSLSYLCLEYRKVRNKSL